MLCTDCGKENPDERTYCSACGKTLGEGQPSHFSQVLAESLLDFQLGAILLGEVHDKYAELQVRLVETNVRSSYLDIRQLLSDCLAGAVEAGERISQAIETLDSKLITPPTPPASFTRKLSFAFTILEAYCSCDLGPSLKEASTVSDERLSEALLEAHCTSGDEIPRTLPDDIRFNLLITFRRICEAFAEKDIGEYLGITSTETDRLSDEIEIVFDQSHAERTELPKACGQLILPLVKQILDSPEHSDSSASLPVVRKIELTPMASQALSVNDMHFNTLDEISGSANHRSAGGLQITPTKPAAEPKPRRTTANKAAVVISTGGTLLLIAASLLASIRGDERDSSFYLGFAVFAGIFACLTWFVPTRKGDPEPAAPSWVEDLETRIRTAIGGTTGRRVMLGMGVILFIVNILPDYRLTLNGGNYYWSDWSRLLLGVAVALVVFAIFTKPKGEHF